ncbi:hypothetical protein PAXINDRAFT_8757 [Paxillus involutus ATCC 200175]|nr:hypothetical protein PAXINDRAFT_8757 [Paxillus involutus ATCC 200175]
MEYPSPIHFSYPSASTHQYPSQDPIFARDLCHSPATEYPASGGGHNEAKFRVDVRVKRAFSFEELQSGSYFKSLDESDFQFLRVYGQPVLIPSPEDADDSLVPHHHVDAYPPSENCRILTFKSYTLENSLGEAPVRSTYAVPQATPSTSSQWQPIERVSCPSNEVSAAMIHSSSQPSSSALSGHTQLYSLRGHENAGMTTAIPPSQLSVQYVGEKPIFSKYDEQPPMDSLPYPPPQNSASPPYFQPSPTMQSGVLLGTPSYIHDAPFQFTTSQEEWEDVPGPAPCLTVSSVLGEFPSSSQAPFVPPQSQHYAPSYGHSRRRRSRSPSPRAQHRMSPISHSRRSLDKKPALACLFCRGRKIACGPPLPGSKDKTCK